MSRSGLNVAGAVRARGDEVEVDDAVADYLVPGGHAEHVTVTSTTTPVEPVKPARRPGRTTAKGR